MLSSSWDRYALASVHMNGWFKIKYLQASRAAAHFEAQVGKIKLEANRQITSLKEQLAAMKSRMANTTTDQAKIMVSVSFKKPDMIVHYFLQKDWEDRRVACERETLEQHKGLQAEVGSLRNQLKEALSQMQQLKGEYAAQIHENEVCQLENAMASSD